MATASKIIGIDQIVVASADSVKQRVNIILIGFEVYPFLIEQGIHIILFKPPHQQEQAH
ncbi:hypothetical protein [uncultured Cohaesibacter sp.]|uniref:hypothetical protein n=1 Tax=uncultured Cohaesibacter sp. TaxID=1002546 RepID=UPI0029C959F4|nr:hypothetical protein [uncultured Cohaesibacter sp.]